MSKKEFKNLDEYVSEKAKALEDQKEGLLMARIKELGLLDALKKDALRPEGKKRFSRIKDMEFEVFFYKYRGKTTRLITFKNKPSVNATKSGIIEMMISYY